MMNLGMGGPGRPVGPFSFGRQQDLPPVLRGAGHIGQKPRGYFDPNPVVQMQHDQAGLTNALPNGGAAPSGPKMGFLDRLFGDPKRMALLMGGLGLMGAGPQVGGLMQLIMQMRNQQRPQTPGVAPVAPTQPVLTQGGM